MKAQMWSMDFIISATMFFLAVILILFAWDYIASENYEQILFNEMQNTGLFVSDVLIRIKGFPLEWTNDNVQSIGLASEENILNETKIYQFINLDYNKIKRLLGLGNYEFYFELNDLDNVTIKQGGIIKPVVALFAVQDPADNQMKDLLENYVDWDYYWGKEEDAPPNNAQYVFDNGKADDIFDMLLNNLSSYNTIILEDPHGAEVETEPEKEALRNFVGNGSIYIHIQHEDKLLRDTFGLVKDGDGDIGTVVNLDPLLKDIKINDTIVFQQKGPAWATSGQPLSMKTIIEKTGDPSKCLVCKWDYGNGMIYYMPDLLNEFAEPVQEFDIVETIFKKGGYPQSASIIIPTERYVLYKGKITKLKFILWV